MVDITTGKKIAEWIKKYGKNLLIACLAMVIVYQELRAVKDRSNFAKERDEFNKERGETIKFERNRQERNDEMTRELIRK